MKIEKIHKFFNFLLLLLITSCGYHFQGSGSSLPDDIKTIAIDIVENDTTFSGLGLRFTEVLRSRFERYGSLQLVENQNEADSILKTRITAQKTQIKEVTEGPDVELETEVILTLSSELIRPSGQVLWKNTNLSATTSFATTESAVVTSSSSFAQGGIGTKELANLGSKEISRGQLNQAIDDIMDEVSRMLYIDAVASYF